MAKNWLKIISRIASPLFAAYRHGKDLTLVLDNTQAINPGDILAFVVLRNEAVRLPYFFAYYRKLGVKHFLLVDNDSSDVFMAEVEARSDCSVWHTKASYKAAKYGVHWLNYLLKKYGGGHWCLTVDPDEFLVFPYCDSRSLIELTAYLDQEEKDSLFSLVLDMYAKGRIDDAQYRQGDDPLQVCPWFDATGYHQDRRPNYGEWWIRGGVRRRVFFADQPWYAPALNKTVLVKWRWNYAYVASTHIVWPNRLNRPHFKDTLAPTGCLLHFKYLSVLRAKAEEEMQRQEHYAGSREYQRYMDGLNANLELWSPASTRFESWRQLVDLGLMNVGRWF